MRLPGSGTRDERGVALVMALLVLLTMSLLAVVLMMNVSTNRKLTGYALRNDQALSVAEAGTNEVCALIRSGDLPLVTTNPRSVGQVFLAFLARRSSDRTSYTTSAY